MDEKDILLLKLLKDNPAISLTEMQNAIRVRSVATVHNRVTVMEKEGLIEAPPQRKQPRSRKITPKGVEFLKAQGIY